MFWSCSKCLSISRFMGWGIADRNANMSWHLNPTQGNLHTVNGQTAPSLPGTSSYPPWRTASNQNITIFHCIGAHVYRVLHNRAKRLDGFDLRRRIANQHGGPKIANWIRQTRHQHLRLRVLAKCPAGWVWGGKGGGLEGPVQCWPRGVCEVW